ncbi:hypothetical protein [Lysobacter sp. CFH 32150]|uniref:hypothetical protein n=1 Tax=Lysobacter sp. CFH 32150 TaxID=2927128 RepID=UPI001FA6B980|nr:hypothetical protein [Lysobacter sp. CFH 32150]MCI4569505.1 hypothetical protein [Lysobacter sp. CFH 32150]
MHVNIPKPVLLSVALLLATHGAGLWQMILLSRTLSVPLWLPYSTLAAVYLLLAALLVMIMRGKRWARSAYTVVGILGLLSVLGHIADLSTSGWLVAAAKVVALVLLYVPASNSWFAGSSPNNSFKPKPLRGSA